MHRSKPCCGLNLTNVSFPLFLPPSLSCSLSLSHTDRAINYQSLVVWAHTGGIWMVTQVHLNWRACVSICSCVRVWLSGLSCTGWESIRRKILCLSYTLFISKLQKLRRKKTIWGFPLRLSWTHLSHVPKLLTKLETERTSSSFKSHHSSIPILQKNSWSHSGSAIDQLPSRSLTFQIRNVHVGIIKSSVWTSTRSYREFTTKWYY